MIGEAIGQVGALGLTDGHGSEARGSGLLVVAQKVNGPK